MSPSGQIIIHDQTFGTGVIRLDNSSQTLIFLEGAISNKGSDHRSLVGRTVHFDLVETASGMQATNIRIHRESMFKAEQWFVFLAAPICIVGTTYFFTTSIGWSTLVSYLAAINLVGATMCLVMAKRRPTYDFGPGDVSLFLVAFCGGAPSVLISTSFVRSRLRSDAGRFFLFALVVAQLMLLYRSAPNFFSVETFRLAPLRSFSTHAQ
jgi:hypothetical protein